MKISTHNHNGNEISISWDEIELLGNYIPD